jgi:hypothetical protein
MQENDSIVHAQDVKVGDVLLGSAVTHISTVRRRGLYAPVTESGTIVVSGVTASCYVDILSSVSPTLQALASHAFLTPLRVMCAIQFSLCEYETHAMDGYSSNLWMMTQLGYHPASWNGMLQWLVVILFTPVFVAWMALETIVVKYCLFVALGSIVQEYVFFFVCI